MAKSDVLMDYEGGDVLGSGDGERLGLGREMGPSACDLGVGAGSREEILWTVPRSREDQGQNPGECLPLGWGVGRAKMLQGDWEGLARVPGAGWQERVGITGAKERDNFIMELASSVRCHRETRTTSPLSKGSVDLVCGDTGNHRQSRFGEAGPKARGVKQDGEAPRADQPLTGLGSGRGEPLRSHRALAVCLDLCRNFLCLFVLSSHSWSWWFQSHHTDEETELCTKVVPLPPPH